MTDEPPTSVLPNRYAIREDDRGPYLTCVRAQNIFVRIDRGLTFAASTARKQHQGAIFLDGAAEGGPFMDPARRVFNLDHHAGVVRSFTLATCEQAMVLVRKKLDLGGGEWQVYANEPDLDTVLAIWVLLNHLRINSEDPQFRQRIMPVLRVEGAIDAHGLDGIELCGYSEEVLARCEEAIAELREEELRLKAEGAWSSSDSLEFTAQVLRAVDGLVYAPEHFEGMKNVDELMRVPLTEAKMAVLCRSDVGIYETERALRDLHGDRVGLVALQQNPRTYTLRLADTFLPVGLEAIYDRLNLIDPAVCRGGATNRWGGSEEIGGSPRRTGTRLDLRRIRDAIAWVHAPPPRRQRLGALAKGSALAAACAAAAVVAAFLSKSPVALPTLDAALTVPSAPPFAVALAAAAALAVLVIGWRSWCRYGIGRPVTLAWLALVPFGALAGALGGSGATPGPVATPWEMLTALIIAPLAAELLLRGAVHGYLVGYYRIQLPWGRWRLSVPTAIAAALTPLLWLALRAGTVGGEALWATGLGMAGALVLGVAAGLARERSRSLAGALLVHGTAAGWATLLPTITP